MTAWDFLISAEGQRLIDAVIVLLISLSTYITFRTHHIAESTSQKLEEHRAEVNALLSTQPVVPPPE